MRIGKEGLALMLTAGLAGCSIGNPPFLDAEPIKLEKATEQVPYKQAIKKFREIADKLPEKEKLILKEETDEAVKKEFHSPDYCLKIEQKKKIPIEPIEYKVELTTVINDEENKLTYSLLHGYVNMNLTMTTENEQYILLYAPTGKNRHARISMVFNRKTCDTKAMKDGLNNYEEKKQLLDILGKINAKYFSH